MNLPNLVYKLHMHSHILELKRTKEAKKNNQHLIIKSLESEREIKKKIDVGSKNYLLLRR